MDLALLLFLILLNGVFAMSEMAVVSSRKARLQRLAEDGSPGADSALELHTEPSKFLSTIQVGITSIGILSGAIGESALADPLTHWLSSLTLLADYARGIALTITVLCLTYFSVVIGELVPKRLALLAPEGIASLMARPMAALSRLARPLVWLFSSSSDVVLKLVGARSSNDPPVTGDEINVLLGQGSEAGVFHESEQKLVSNVMGLDEQRIGVIMTPRMDIYYLDLDDSDEEIRNRIIESRHSRIVVCRDGLEHIIGILRIVDILKSALTGEDLDIESLLSAPLYVPDSVTTIQLLENFRHARAQCALIVDEYGDLEGLVTLTDVLTAIVGELPSSDVEEEKDIVVREDGSWLVDGAISVERLRSEIDLPDDVLDEEEANFNTLGGLIMHALGRLPAVADVLEREGWRFEVVDMDKNRVDKVLIAKLPPEIDASADSD